MKKQAFTLIEVMVVLSILAIIAILAYNFFGNTMKQANLSSKVTKVQRDMIAIMDATDKWCMDNNTINQPGSYETTLVNDGMLKSWPEPPAGTAICGGGTCNGMYDYLVVDGYDDYDVDGNADDVISLGDLTTEFCTAFADEVGTSIYDYNTNPDFSGWGGGKWVVFDWSGVGTDDCEIHLIRQYR